MSTKILQAFSDDNPDLKKQIGCMSGIFQMFERHHLLTGRRLNGHNHKKLITSGHGHLNSGNLGEEPYERSPRFFTDKISKRSLNENQRASVESSRASFSSSSCSSSFSSFDCSKSTQQEHFPFEHSAYPERSVRNSSKLQCSNIDTRRIHSVPCNDIPNASAQSGRQSLDFRDVVKDSMYKDTHSLSVKTMRQEEVKKPVMKHRDSPRPLPLSKSVDGSDGVGTTVKSRMSMDLNESRSVLEKIKGHWYFSDAKEPQRSSSEARNGSFFSAPKEAHRFSYDGKEVSRQSLDSRENSKYANKLRELPRLSLDSRENSMRTSNFDTKSNPVLKDRNNANQRISSDFVLHQETRSRDQPRGVVAKLMGLEAIPNLSVETAKSDTFDAKTNNNSFSKPKEVAKEMKQDLFLQSPKSLRRDFISPPERNPDLVKKPTSNSRFPVETAPWKQHARSQGTQKRAFRFRDTHTKQKPETVYSEIERRLKDLEFLQLQHSNKDLRALKQILDAIQSKGVLETKKDEDRTPEVSGQRTSTRQSHTGLDQDSRSQSRKNTQNSYPISTEIRGTSSPRRPLESPIVIMKPAKSVNRSSVPPTDIPLDSISGLQKIQTSNAPNSKRVWVNNRMAKDQTSKLSLRESTSNILSTDKKSNTQNEECSSVKPRSRILQGSPNPQQATKQNSGSSTKTPSSLSPRLQRRIELEKKSRPPVPSSDLSKPRRKSTTRQPSESVSPRNKLRSKSNQARTNDNQLSEKCKTMNLSAHDDEISLRSDSNMSLASEVDIEVTRADRSAELNSDFLQQGNQSPSCKAARNATSSIKKKKSSSGLIEDGLSAELATFTPEQPSPVSVLDPSFYRDDLTPSPAEKIADSFKGIGARNSDNITVEGGWNPLGLNSRLPSAPEQNFNAEINHKKLENIENLVQKLRQLSSEDGEAPGPDHIATLCETQNPDHRYVSEILLASGLLFKELGAGVPVQLHQSGYPINPDLFLVLEQKNSGYLAKPELLCEINTRPKSDPEKFHRKLIFDTVNEILIDKLRLAGTSNNSIPRLLRAGKLTDRTPSGQHLLRELCSEIDLLQTERSLNCSLEDDDNLKPILSEDIQKQSEHWKTFGMEVPGMVLDIERSIFKDLIAEVVSFKAAPSGVLAMPNRRRRQLFVE